MNLFNAPSMSTFISYVLFFSDGMAQFLVRMQTINVTSYRNKKLISEFCKKQLTL